MVTWNLVNIGSDNGLLPDGTKPLPEPMLTNHKWGLVAFTWGQFHGKCSRYLSFVWLWKMINLRLQLHLPGTNELSHIKNNRTQLHITDPLSNEAHWPAAGVNNNRENFSNIITPTSLTCFMEPGPDPIHRLLHTLKLIILASTTTAICHNGRHKSSARKLWKKCVLFWSLLC